MSPTLGKTQAFSHSCYLDNAFIMSLKGPSPHFLMPHFEKRDIRGFWNGAFNVAFWGILGKWGIIIQKGAFLLCGLKGMWFAGNPPSPQNGALSPKRGISGHGGFYANVVNKNEAFGGFLRSKCGFFGSWRKSPNAPLFFIMPHFYLPPLRKIPHGQKCHFLEIMQHFVDLGDFLQTKFP